MRLVLRRLVLLLVACAIAAGAVLAERTRTHVVRVDLGPPGDTGAVNADWHAAAAGFGRQGRWTSGAGVVTVPRAGRYATVVRAGVCAHPARPRDHVRIAAGAFEVAEQALDPGCQVVEVPVRHAVPDQALTVGFASITTTEGEGRPRGVFVDWVEVEADGPVPLRRGVRAVAWLALLFVATLLAAWDIGVLATGATTAAAIAASATGAAWLAVDRLVPSIADLERGAAWAVAAALLACAVRLANARVGQGADGSAVDRRGGVWAWAALAAALAVVFRETLLHGRVLSQGDLLFQVFPWRAAVPDGLVIGNRLLADVPLVFYPFLTQVVDAFRAGTLPLWSSHLYTGHPFFASFQSAVLSPFTWIAAAVPLPWGTVAGAVARLLAAGGGTLCFARRIGLGWTASAFAAVAFAMNAFSIVWLEHPLSAVAAWLPWLLWAAEGVAVGPRPRATAILAAVVALTVFAGHPETALKVLACGGLYGLARAAASPPRLRAAGWIVAGYALGLAIGAVQILPFAEYLQVSRTRLLREAATHNATALPPRVAITALVPDFWGHPVSQDYAAQTNSEGVPANYAEQQAYPGVVTCVLACVGLVAWRQWRVRFFVAAALISAALAFGPPALLGAVTSLPVLKVTLLSRFGLLVIVSVIVLAAVGVDALVRGAARPAARLGAAAVAGAIIIVVAIAAALSAFQADLSAAHLQQRATAGGLFAAALALLVAGLAWGRARGRIAAPVFGAAAGLALIAELAAFATGARSWIPVDAVFPSTPAIAAAQRDRGLFRVLGVFDVLPANTAMAFGLADPRGYDGLGPADLSDLLDVSLVFRGSFHMLTHAAASPVVNLLNVKYVFAPPGVDLPAPQFARVVGGGAPLFLNRDALPRLFLADGYVVRTGNLARRTLRDGLVDLRRTAVLDAELPPEARPDPAGADGPGRVDVRHYRDHFVGVTTSAAGRRLLVFTDLFYPGWTADIDGRPVEIRRANFAFRAVSVPAGTHTVRFRYRPASVIRGAVLSGLGIVVALALCWRRTRPQAARGSITVS
jgi:hypothetical protein